MCALTSYMILYILMYVYRPLTAAAAHAVGANNFLIILTPVDVQGVERPRGRGKRRGLYV